MFYLLAGTGAFLYRERAGSVGKVSRFLLTRGIWLVVLEWTIIEFAWTFVPWTFGGVIWSLGVSMVILAGLVWLPEWAILTFGLALVATHDLFDVVKPTQMGSLGWVWALLHCRGVVPGTHLFILFPLVPWVGRNGMRLCARKSDAQRAVPSTENSVVSRLDRHSGTRRSARIERIRKSGRWRGRKLARSVAPASYDIDDDGLLS
jgi:uncharacterized membrane protein